jgi:hypothetical protein
MIRWVFGEFLFVWLTAIPIIGAVLAIWFFRASEPSIRITGMVLQILGLIPIFKSILDLRREFGFPGIIRSLKSSWGKRPKYKPAPIMMTGTATIGPFRAGISAYQSVPSSGVDPIDKQLEALRLNIEMLRRDFEANRKAVDDALEKCRHERTRLQREQSSKISRLTEKLRSINTSGLAWSASGAIWIGVGIVLSSMSIEIHGWW